MRTSTKVIAIAAVAAGITVATGTGTAIAARLAADPGAPTPTANDEGSGESTDPAEIEAPIVGSDLERASAAALEHVGQGRVTETEVGDEDSLYEVEVTLADGSQIDVQLDEQFAVMSSEADDESPDE